ncbi:hypothetical protein B0H10DRAFT_691108 [Mycena sp. CBHHK59/15]|nr:hypothetical protein B0H10DRAFT_691108 [Mycena sp. CBHHK59/15]
MRREQKAHVRRTEPSTATRLTLSPPTRSSWCLWCVCAPDSTGCPDPTSAQSRESVDVPLSYAHPPSVTRRLLPPSSTPVGPSHPTRSGCRSAAAVLHSPLCAVHAAVALSVPRLGLAHPSRSDRLEIALFPVTRARPSPPIWSLAPRPSRPLQSSRTCHWAPCPQP